MTALAGRKINTVEATFISDISEREAHRVIAEKLLSNRTPEEGSERRFELIDLILLHFYFHSKDLTKPARLNVIKTAIAEFGSKFHLGNLRHKKWIVNVDAEGNIKADLTKSIKVVQERVKKMEIASALVCSHDDILAGEPVFRGTRVPVRTVDLSLKKGMSPDEIIENFPSLNLEMISAAPLWAQLNPLRGRPKNFTELNPMWELQSDNGLQSAHP